MQPNNIIFVKHGTKYNAKHVNRLADQLFEYYPSANYYCYTEDPGNVNISIIPIFKKPSLKVWWNKLALFSNDMPLEGKCLFFDLDMDVKSDPSQYITDFSGLTVIEDYYKVGKPQYDIRHAYDVTINSSVITWTAREQNHIWEHFLTNKDYFMRKYVGMDRFLVHEKFKVKTFKTGLVNSVANPLGKPAAINMYNGVDYEL
jgi:hypothetical protein